MPDFKPTEDIISLSEFRTTLADCVARTRETHRPIILTQNGRASSVFLDAADWEAIATALEDARTQRGFLISEGQHARGEVKSHEQVKKLMRQNARRRESATEKRTRMAV